MNSTVTLTSALAAAICLGAAATPAFAAPLDRSFSIDSEALTIQGTAVKSSTIALPKSGTSAFFVKFVVPLDHAINTPISVVVYMQQPNVGPCTAATVLSATTRRRIGQASYSKSPPNLDGIAPAGGVEQTDFPATGGVIVGKTYIVRKPQFAPFTRLRAGDGISMRIDRVSADAADTCTGNVFVSHVDVRYTAATAP